MPGKTFGPRKPYLSIVQGTIRQSVDKETKGAIKREYEMKETKQTGVKYELIFMDWYGRIEDFRIKEGKFGEVLELEFKDAILQIHLESKYFTDFACKLPNINFGQNVILHPYDFEPEPGKKRTGIKVEQNGEKIPSFYWDNDKKEDVNGFPVKSFNPKNASKDNWKMHFLLVKTFLKEEINNLRASMQKHSEESLEEPEQEVEVEKEVDKFDKAFPEDKKKEKLIDKDEEEVKIEDVPF